MEDRPSIALSGFLVKAAGPRITDLTVHAKFNTYHNPPDADDELALGLPEYINPRELQDSPTGPGLIVRTIFAHQLPFDTCEPLANLTQLNLHHVNVRYAADNWCRVIAFKKLNLLRIFQCSGADALLGQLCKASHLPATLKAFSLEHIDSAENETLLALDGFLCLVSGIRYLYIDLKHAKELPSKHGIARHGKTLEILSVHAWKEVSRAPTASSSSSSLPFGEELVYQQQDLETICSACAGLTQLSLAYPPHFITRPPSSVLHLFETTILRNLRKLVTLQITSWPSNGPGGETLPRSIYEILLQASALRLFNMAASFTSQLPPASSPTADGNDNGNNTPTILSGPDAASISDFHFTTASTPALRLIAYSVADQIYDRLEPETQIVCFRSTSVDAEGRTRLHAAPIGWCLKQSVEPESNVLNATLLRTPKPPFSGRDGA